MSLAGIVSGLVSEGTAVVAGGDGRAYRIHRIRSGDLAVAGLAELVGAVAADEALSTLRDELRASTGDPERLAEIRERAAAAQAEAAARHLARDPRALAAVAERMDRTVCAGVTGIGVVGPDVEAGALATCDVEPVRLVYTETGDADHAAGRVWVGYLPESTRTVLFDAIEALSGATMIRPFRGSAGGTPAA